MTPRTLHRAGLPVVAALMAALAAAPGGRAADIGYVEAFALAQDRAAALKQLVPGTEEYYYYHALHALQTEQYEAAGELFRPWLNRFGRTPRFVEIETRLALLTFDRDPKKAFDYVRGRLGLRFDHQKEVAGVPPGLPTALDPAAIARDTLTKRTLASYPNLENFEDSAFDWLPVADFSWDRRRNFLQRLQRPDVPGLAKLVADDLADAHPIDFGGHPVHALLTRDQLDELLTLRPVVLNHPTFVNVYVSKLHPGEDDAWRRDRALTLAYLDRLQSFVGRLAPVHNPLKAHLFYHRLAFDRAQGVYDLGRFVAYLQLPRRQPYMNRDLLDRGNAGRYPADLGSDYLPVTLLPRVGADEELVRSYLKHFLKDAADAKAFGPYIDATYLAHLFAEVKAEAGLGDGEAIAGRLPPELFRAVQERVDIDFAYTNKTAFAAGEPVALDLFIKNVPNLLVKVFEVNTTNVYRTTQKEIDTDITLDGLVANSEATHAYAEPPVRRVARRFAFPSIAKPGVYVIDYIGGGKSSRALVRVGRLRPLVATGPAGQEVTVVDESNQVVPDAVVWLGGREYKADKAGTAVVPFTAAPGVRPLVLTRGDFSSLDALNHRPEAYQLTAGIHVDRESLLTQRVAQLLIRPAVTLAGRPVSVKLLEDVRLRVTSTDHAGVPTSTEVPDVRLFEDRETTHEVRVPARLSTLTVTLTAKVRSRSENKPIDLAVTETFALNGIAKTDKLEGLHFARFGPDYAVELLGRTGEPRADRPVQLSLKHRDFRQPVNVLLKTDAQGRVKLGPLADILTVTATGPEGTPHTWAVPTDRHTYRQLVHAKLGETVTLPYLGTAAAATRADFALFEVTGSTIRADRFEALAVKDGLLELRGLAAGDYDLWLKRAGERVRVRVVAGADVAGYVLGARRDLERPRLQPVQIESVTADAAAVTIRVRNASPFTRVHLFATRYRPAFSAFDHLGRVRPPELAGTYPGFAESVYLTGRNIGDEYRYVLDRRGQKKYPGNMLDRPQLLLNPWAVRSTETGEQLAAGGDAFGRSGGAVPSTAAPAPLGMGTPDGKPAPPPAPGGDFADLDFLADASAVVTNLVPDKDGVIRVPRKAIGPHAMLQAVAVDPLHTTSRHVSLPEVKAAVADLRLKDGLDPARHFAQQQQVTVVEPGKPLEVADIGASRFQVYDSLPKVYGLFATLSKDPKLAEFAFVTTWPAKKPEEKRALYSKYACHELNFFLAKRDPEFFAAVVRPYLANKKDKTFLDHYLVDADLARYREPWAFGRLNAVERILLAQRTPGEPAKTARHLADMLRLLPVIAEQELYQFNVGVQGEALAADSARADHANPSFERKLADNDFRTPMMPKPAAGSAGSTSVRGAVGDPKKSEDNALREEARREALKQDAEKKYAQRDGTADAKANLRKQLLAAPSEKDAESRQGLYFNVQPADAAAVRQLYRKVDPTQEWAEDNYYHLPITQQVAGLVPVNALWADYARHDGKSPFLSKHFPAGGRNFTEMMFTLAVLDLPFTAGKHESKFAAGRLTLTPGTRLIAFHEEVRPADGPGGQVPVLVSENFYRPTDRFREEAGEKLDKFVTGEFVAHTVYGGQVVVTNPTSSRQKLSVLVQLPVGAVPLAAGQFTRGVPLDLEPYRTGTVDYLFYFPAPGDFAHFPAHVSKAGQYVASAQATPFHVVAVASKPDAASWDYVSQNGTTEDVLAFLARENVNALNLDKIAFRMADRGVYEAVIKLLADRHVYSPTLWSYSLLHADVPTAAQYLQHVDSFVNEVGGPIVSPLLTIDPVARHQYEHLEYKPLVNARTHALGKTRQVVNARVHEQYHRFLKTLSYRKSLTAADRLDITYYLLLQDRIEEALATFARVDPAAVATRLQYDYCAAYLALFGEDVAAARSIASKHLNHPVDRWRSLFAAVVAQLDEAEGKGGPKVADPADKAQQQGQLAATEPTVEFTLDPKAVNLTWRNLTEVRVNYYLMDVELLFSRGPFAQQAGDQFAVIRPTATQEVKLAAGQSKQAVPLPADLVGRNVLVEVTGGGVTRSLPHYATAMGVELTEAYGRLRATDAAGKPLAKAYVKVYARLADGRVQFHKDGYTDLRGRFDYATVSAPDRQPVARFAILVLSDDRGAATREAAPPQQ